jgi:hypothetical protein
MTAAVTTAGAVAGHQLDDEFVLQGRPLRPGQALHETARFRDPQWPLRPAILQRSQKSHTLNFEAIPARYRHLAKELCFAMLSGPLPLGERRPALATVHNVLTGLAPFLAWLDSLLPRSGRPTPPVLAALTGVDLEAYQRHLLAVAPGRTTRDQRRSAVRQLWRYRHAMLTDRLPFDPHHVEGWNEPRRRGSSENTTDRIPEAVHGPLLAWALRFVDDFADDILLAINQRTTLRGTRRRRPTGRSPRAMSAPDCDHCWTNTSPRAVPCPGERARSTFGSWPRRWPARAAASSATAPTSRPSRRRLASVTAPTSTSRSPAVLTASPGSRASSPITP